MGKIIDLFREPSSFPSDPVNWSYSQIGHGYLGFTITTLLVWSLLYLEGDYPNAQLIALLVPAVYFLWWEIDIQGWRGWDSVEDSLFVMAGAALYIFIDMSHVIDRLALWVSITSSAIVLGIYRRMEN